MSKRKKSPVIKGETIVLPKEELRKAASRASHCDVCFKTGRYMTEKDRPRKKDWRREYE